MRTLNLPANLRPRLRTACCLLILTAACWTLSGTGVAAKSTPFDSPAGQTAPELDRQVRADMAFLADDEMHGRGSATRDEHIAALYVAARFQALGLVPGGEDGTYLQKVPLPSPLPQRTQQRIARYEDTPRTQTWNAIGILRGSATPEEAVLLTAHLDHLGVANAASSGDIIYNGADDDASGTAAVLAFAKALAGAPRPRRDVIFALFGSEELGGFGNAAFLAHPPMPLGSIVANLEFEMIGRRDPSIASDALWLTGYERSNLGAALLQHGARLVPDPHPGENFFRRSDNYALARQGVVAHTVSSFGLHKDYHKPSDELSRIDFRHLVGAISSMTGPVEWLANTEWRPVWNPGGKP